MNILYITNLSTNIAAGLNWSVPATVNAQSEIDNVFWLNLSNVVMDHWKDVKAFHNISEFGNDLTIENLPSPFDNPDVVVFEGFYHPKDPKLAKKLRKKGIPYIITPRGSFTRQGQRLGGVRKRLKKLIANILIFKPYARKALAIQYLTRAEQKDSTGNWNKRSFVVPNGFKTPSESKEEFTKNGIKALFIGRLDKYHKGLDVLLEAIHTDYQFLKKHNFSLQIYGPQRYDYLELSEFIAKHNLTDVVTLNGEITGDDKKRALLSSDLFVLTSRFEGHPMGLVEAIAYGLPSLVTPGSNMGEEIRHNDCGWVCEPTSESIAKTLKIIIQNNSLLPTKGKNSLRLSESYGWERIAKDFHENVHKLLESNIVNR